MLPLIQHSFNIFKKQQVEYCGGWQSCAGKRNTFSPAPHCPADMGAVPGD